MASFGHTECMDVILAHRPNLNAKERVSDNTPLHEAVAHAHAQCTLALVEHGADLKAKDEVWGEAGSLEAGRQAGTPHPKPALVTLMWELMAGGSAAPL